MSEFKVSSRAQLLQAIHTEASVLVQEWWPDSMNLPRDRRIAEISLMQMLCGIVQAEATVKFADAVNSLVELLKE